uniref:LRAT domain-containing protein n=1 Tax=Panagrolaimus sp. PS1159 TaxID=55785 RepID=A0AC35EW15_9BILA
MTNVGVIGHWQTYPEILGDIEEGDVIEFDRGIFSHFGVYIGRQGTAHYIIHKVGDGFELFSISSASSSTAWSSASKEDRARCTKATKTKGVRQDLLEAVCAGKKCRINNQVDEDSRSGGPHSREIIVDRCCDKLTDCSYDWANDNCEHFANWCRTGLSISYQVSSIASNVPLLVVSPGAFAIRKIFGRN